MATLTRWQRIVDDDRVCVKLRLYAVAVFKLANADALLRIIVHVDHIRLPCYLNNTPVQEVRDFVVTASISDQSAKFFHRRIHNEFATKSLLRFHLLSVLGVRVLVEEC